MIKRLDISGQHITLTPEIQSYISKKIGKLDRYVARAARGSLHGEVRICERKAKDKRRFVCEVVLHLPGEIITAKETTIAVFSSIDIVEEQLKTQLRKYKEKRVKEVRATPKMRRLFMRLNRNQALAE